MSYERAKAATNGDLAPTGFSIVSLFSFAGAKRCAFTLHDAPLFCSTIDRPDKHLPLNLERITSVHTYGTYTFGYAGPACDGDNCVPADPSGPHELIAHPTVSKYLGSGVFIMSVVRHKDVGWIYSFISVDYYKRVVDITCFFSPTRSGQAPPIAKSVCTAIGGRL